MTIQKVENSVIGNRVLIAAIVADLEEVFRGSGYKPKDSIESIMYDEGRIAVIGYLKRKYDV